MAISKNILLKQASGRIGTDMVLKQYGDKTVICRYPDMSQRVLSEKQLENNQRMENANSYAKDIINDPVRRDAAQVRLDVTRKKLYTSLVREYFALARAGDGAE